MKKLLVGFFLFLILIVGIRFFFFQEEEATDRFAEYLASKDKYDRSLPQGISVKIAVVGSGISSASTVFFLNNTIKDHVKITVYEKNKTVGGRMKIDSLGGGHLEQGGTLLHSSNYFLRDIIQHYNLEEIEPHRGKQKGSPLGIWDGEKFRIQLSANSTIADLQLLWRYQSLPALSKIVKSTLVEWEQLYPFLNNGGAFDTPEDFYKKLGLYELTQVDSYTYFEEQGISKPTVEEFINGISRVNYAQDAKVNALTNLISLAGGGLAGGYLASVKGGNDQMAKKVLEESSINLRLNHEVLDIREFLEEDRPQYLIADSQGKTDTFDIVVIACPLDLTTMNIPIQVKRDRHYMDNYATFVAGKVNPSYFGIEEGMPNYVFTVENKSLPFYSLAAVSYAPDWDLSIYKLFSPKELPKSLLDSIFIERKGTKTQYWKAYTRLEPMKEWPPFKLADGLFYTNAMESSFSSMEGQAVAGKNVANLIIQYLKKRIEE